MKDITILTENEIFTFTLKDEENFDILLGKTITSFTVNSLAINKLNVFLQLLKNYIQPAMVRH